MIAKRYNIITHKEDTRKKERIKCMQSLYYLVTNVLEYHDLYEPLHKPMCDWFQARPQETFRLSIFPRGTFKTTVGTIGDSLYTWLWDPNVRIYNAHEKKDQTQLNLSAIKHHMAENDKFRAIAPDICWNDPKNDSPMWLADRIVIRRPKYSQIPSFLAGSTGASVVGMHYNKFKFDDVVGPENVNTQALIDSVISWFQAIVGTFHRPIITNVDAIKILVDIIGTPWALNDLYGWMQDPVNKFVGKPGKKNYIISNIHGLYGEPGTTQGNCIFPTKYTPEVIEETKVAMGAWHFSAQMLCKCVPSDAKMFDVTKVHLYETLPEGRSYYYYTAIDPSRVQKAGNHPGCILTCAKDYEGNIYVVDCIYRQFSFDEMTELLGYQVRLWHPHRVFIETTAGQNYVYEAFLQWMRKNGVFCTVLPLPRSGGPASPERIRVCQSPVEYGKLHLLTYAHPLYEEMKDYPFTKADHALDCLADIVHCGNDLPTGPAKNAEPHGTSTLERLIKSMERQHTGPVIAYKGKRW